MKRDYIDFQDRSTPLAYLITFRTFGTWLHGDERGSMDRREYHLFGGMKIAPSILARRRDRNLMKSPAFELDAAARSAVEQTIREVLEVRQCSLFAINVRTNHVHVVPAAGRTPESLMVQVVFNAKAPGTWDHSFDAKGLVASRQHALSLD